jgi:hypothetical protein
MSGVPLDPPKDYGDIPPPGIRCSPENARASSLIGPGGTILVGTQEAPPSYVTQASEGILTLEKGISAPSLTGTSKSRRAAS